MNAGQSVQHQSESSSGAAFQRGRSLFFSGWLLAAVAVCWLSWPTPAEAMGGGPACLHGVCEEGDSLNQGCGDDTCVFDICNDPILGDSYCCAPDGEWDAACVALVLPICGDVSCAQLCSHSPCEIGDPLDSTCNFCTALICFQDPSCCDELGTWSQACVDKVALSCGYECNPGEDTCSDAHPDFGGTPITMGKLFGTLLGSSLDGNESENVSGQAHDVWYSYTHQGDVDESFAVSTCMTQRSFAIDTVLSIHEGCPGRRNNEIRMNDDHGLGLAWSACASSPSPINLDAAIPMGGFWELEQGQTVMIRVAHHNESVRNNFELRLMPEPAGWQALVAGAGALGLLWRRRARG